MEEGGNGVGTFFSQNPDFVKMQRGAKRDVGSKFGLELRNYAAIIKSNFAWLVKYFDK